MVIARFVVRTIKDKTLLDRRVEENTLRSAILQINTDIRNYRKRGKKTTGKDPLSRWQRIEIIIEKNNEIQAVPKITLLGKEYAE